MTGETKTDISGWTVDTLFAHFRLLVDERDRRYEDRFQIQKQAVEAALASQEKAVAAALAAADRAVAKAEAASEKRFESVNEFRDTLSDQATRLMPRAESDMGIAALREQMAALSKELDGMKGQGRGMKDAWGYLTAAVGIIVAIAAVILTRL